MSENVIVTDTGFAPDAHADAEWHDVTPGDDLTDLIADPGQAAHVRIAFGSSADGRGFTLARQLRAAGFKGRLRAAGHVLADQYTMARRSGFDEVEIDAALASRQDETQWQARADWRTGDYRARLRPNARA